MSSTKDFANYVTSDLLREIPGVSARAMFGGFGLYKGGVIFGLIADNIVYLKVDDVTKAEFTKRGSKQFMTMPYFELPERIMDNPEELSKWVLTSVEVSLSSKKIKAKKRR